MQPINFTYSGYSNGKNIERKRKNAANEQYSSAHVWFDFWGSRL